MDVSESLGVSLYLSLVKAQLLLKTTEQIFSLLQTPALWILNSQAVFHMTFKMHAAGEQITITYMRALQELQYMVGTGCHLCFCRIALHLLLTSSDSQNAFSDFQKRFVMIHFFLYEAIVVRRWHTLIVDFQRGGLFSGIKEPWCYFLASAISGRLKELALIKQDWQPLPKRAEHFPQVKKKLKSKTKSPQTEPLPPQVWVN